MVSLIIYYNCDVFGNFCHKQRIKSIINYSTVGTIIDKEYTKSTFITHQRYQFKVSFIDNVDGKDEESVEWIDVTPTEYDEYEIGDKYEDSSRGKKE